MLRKLKFYLKQLFPLTYVYDNPNGPYKAVWKMWFGKIYDCQYTTNYRVRM